MKKVARILEEIEKGYMGGFGREAKNATIIL